MLLTFLLAVNATLIAGVTLFTCDALREQEALASKRGYQLLGALGVLTLAIALLPGVRPPLAVVYTLALAGAAALLRPRRSNSRALRGAQGYVVGHVQRVDERDIVFARNRSLRPGSDEYRTYYADLHPERKERDDRRRAAGGPLSQPGKIDGWRANSAMMFANFQIPAFLGVHATAAPMPDHPPAELDPRRASEIVKGLAVHLGAVSAGVCRVDPRWV